MTETSSSGPAVRSVDRVDAVGLLRRMVEIRSESYSERPVAEFLVEEMTRLGFRARIDRVGNIIGEIGEGDGPTLMLLGHIDTVPGGPEVEIREGKLFGRGSVDAKGPFAAMICAAAQASGFPGRIVAIGVVEEETPKSRGAVEIRETHQVPDAVIVGEPSGWSNVVLGYKGKLDLRYTVRCPETHPTSPEPKASELAASCWMTLLELLGPAAGHGSFSSPGATLYRMDASLSEATALLGVRTPPDFDTGGLVRRLRARLPAGELEVLNDVAACRADRSNPIVRALITGIRRLEGRPRLVLKTATSDMNTLAEVWRGVPMVTYGPGDSRLDHSENEHVELEEYLRGIDVLRTAIGEMAGRPADARPAGIPDSALTTEQRLGGTLS